MGISEGVIFFVSYPQKLSIELEKPKNPLQVTFATKLFVVIK